MKKVRTGTEFVALTEEEVLKAIDRYETLSEDGEEESVDSSAESLVMAEIARLITAYADRFDEYCDEGEEFPAEVLEYEPDVVIEQIAFDIFVDALHDALQDADSEPGDE
jgi:hypothetical protein